VAKKSTVSGKASNGRSTHKKTSNTLAKSPKNSTWLKTLARHPELGVQLQDAIDLFQAGRAEEASQILQALVGSFPNHAFLWWYLGGVYRAIKINPKSERCSLGLFHTLWDLDQVDEAIAEIRRYQMLTNWSCQDYLEIVSELYEEWVVRPKAKKKVKPKKVRP
jgi:predicted Zn-dependent protease